MGDVAKKMDLNIFQAFGDSTFQHLCTVFALKWLPDFFFFFFFNQRNQTIPTKYMFNIRTKQELKKINQGMSSTHTK